MAVDLYPDSADYVTDWALVAFRVDEVAYWKT